eukprot:CAMPEP_0119485544 /NCGR_PEP_ID=MMETSP1344-20130328/12222_1 /TAXON_ID=236787 /ORGANISM="Florenciella parvula, Strain CCMP2471" /LENGTH=43 /DNA_ID= /DNA_START= /DNA_END= /DNA_ORIENTATION=
MKSTEPAASTPSEISAKQSALTHATGPHPSGNGRARATSSASS